METPLKLFRLVSMSDPCTLYAPSIEVAGAAAALMSPNYGSECLDACDEADRYSPVLLGWDTWLEARGIDQDWLERHAAVIADALDSLVLGSPGERRLIDEILAPLSPDERRAWIAQRAERRSSMNNIAARAVQVAAGLRASYSTQASEPSTD